MWLPLKTTWNCHCYTLNNNYSRALYICNHSAIHGQNSILKPTNNSHGSQKLGAGSVDVSYLVVEPTHLKKYARQNGNHLPQFLGWTLKKKLKPPPRRTVGIWGFPILLTIWVFPYMVVPPKHPVSFFPRKQGMIQLPASEDCACRQGKGRTARRLVSTTDSARPVVAATRPFGRYCWWTQSCTTWDV